MADAKTSAADKAAADRAATEQAAADDAAARKEAAAAVEAAKAAEDDEVTRVNWAARDAQAAEEAARPTTKALSLAKTLEGFVDTNGQEVFDEALSLLGGRQEAADVRDEEDRKVAGRQRREAVKDRGVAPAGRTTPERKAG